MFYRKAPTKNSIFHGKIYGFRFHFSQQNQSIWVNFITTSLFSRSLEIMVFIWEIIPLLWPQDSGQWNMIIYPDISPYIPIFHGKIYGFHGKIPLPIHWKRPDRSIHLWSLTLRRGDSVQRVQPERPSWKGERRPWVGHGSKIEGFEEGNKGKNGWNPRNWVNQENRFEWTCWRHLEFNFCL